MINVGGWRDDAAGPMQVVSGPVGRQRVHFEAPPADRLEEEVGRFLDWLNGASHEPPLLEVLARGVLRKTKAGGRSTSHELNDLPE